MLDAGSKEGFCTYCGSKLKVQDVINRVKIDKTGDAANYLALAEAACEGVNADEAYEYANKAIEVDAGNAQAWLLKLKALEVATHTGLAKRSEESVACGNKILSLAPSLSKEVYLLWLSHAKGMLDYRIKMIPETTLCAEKFDELVPRVMILRRAVTSEEIAKDEELAKGAVELADSLKEYQFYVNKYDEPLGYAELRKYQQCVDEILLGVPDAMKPGYAVKPKTTQGENTQLSKRATQIVGCLAIVVFFFLIFVLVRFISVFSRIF